MSGWTLEVIVEDWIRVTGGLGEKQDNERRTELQELRRKAAALDFVAKWSSDRYPVGGVAFRQPMNKHGWRVEFKSDDYHHPSSIRTQLYGEGETLLEAIEAAKE
jgi:hypothetical protein